MGPTLFPIKEHIPTFLEVRTLGKTPMLKIDWNWEREGEEGYTYKICLKEVSSWSEAYLLVDGDQVKSFSEYIPCFSFTFDALKVGKHKASMLIYNKNGEFGVVHRPLRVRP